jgi:hypothetical protein
MNEALRNTRRNRDGDRDHRSGERERQRRQLATPEPSDDGDDDASEKGHGRKRKAGGSKKKKDKRRKRQRKDKKKKPSRCGRDKDSDDEPDDSSGSSGGSSSGGSSDGSDSDASGSDPGEGPSGGTGSRKRNDKHMDAVFQRARKVVGKFEEGADVSTFIMIFEKESADLTPRLKMQLLRMALVPSAVNFYRDVVDKYPEADGKWPVDKWLRKLRATYEPDKRQRRTALLERKQAAGEDATIYVRDVVRLCRAYNKDMDDLEMVGYIVNNIHPDYRREVQRVGVLADQSVSKIERTLRNTMALLQADGAGTSSSQYARSKAVVVRPSVASLYVAPEEPVVEEPRETVRDVVKEVQQSFRDDLDSQLKKTLEVVAAASKAAEHKKEPRRDRKDESTTDNACYRCFGTGHYARDCPNRRSGKEDHRRKSGGGSGNPNHQPLGSSKGTSGGCFRCGRTGHNAVACYAKRHIDGTDLSSQPKVKAIEAAPERSGNGN